MELQGGQQNKSESTVFIPAKEKIDPFADGHIFRTCAYCRVSTDRDEQLSSFELQREHYMRLAGQHPNWELKHIFADEGISGTSLKNRTEFNAMIAACMAGQYDLIVTKSVSRFARNLVDCVSLARKLKQQNPPVGIFFETDTLFTLSEDSEFKLSMLAAFAQEESVKKSESMNWSLRERFKNEKLLMPELFGYRRPRDAAGNFIKYEKLEIEEREAVVVRFIYNAFLAGYSLESIASILSEIGCKTKLGNTVWSEGSIRYILQNERYCGNVLTWKTFTADIFEHRKRKNRKDRDQILYKNKHDAIISAEQFDAAQILLSNKKHGYRGCFPCMQVINTGALQGYVPINHHWMCTDPEVYYEASNSVSRRKKSYKISKSKFSAFDLSGYQVVRGQFVSVRIERPCMTIREGKITFNRFCVKEFIGVGYVQLLLHPTERKMAIRPCGEKDIYSIPWRSRLNGMVSSKTITCTHFISALSQIMEWHPDCAYKILGTLIAKGNDRIIIFHLSDAMPAVPMTNDSQQAALKHWVSVCPESWEGSFGEDFYSFSLKNEFYYFPFKTEEDISEKSQVVSGMSPVKVFTEEELFDTVERLKQIMKTEGRE